MLAYILEMSQVLVTLEYGNHRYWYRYLVSYDNGVLSVGTFSKTVYTCLVRHTFYLFFFILNEQELYKLFSISSPDKL